MLLMAGSLGKMTSGILTEAGKGLLPWIWREGHRVRLQL